MSGGIEFKGQFAVREKYKDKQIIIKEGTYGEAVYVVLSGKVSISIKSGSENIIIGYLKEGDVLGQLSFIDREPRSATITAVGDVTMGIIDKDYLENEINKTSENLRIIIKALIERLRETTNSLSDITMKYHALMAKLETYEKK